MKNYLNNIVVTLKINENTSSPSNVFYYDKNNFEFSYMIDWDGNKCYRIVLLEILNYFYDFEIDIKKNLIDYIEGKFENFPSSSNWSSFYFPLRELTEEEKFYIILTCGDIGQTLIKEHTS